MKYLLSYSTYNMFLSQKKLEKSALKLWADEVFSLNPFWLRIQNEFWRKNKKILQCSRGGGYWVWKPFIISKILPLLKEKDVLIYSDSGIEIIEDLTPLENICIDNDGILLFTVHEHQNFAWTKRDCFVFMNCDSEKYYYVDQAMGGFSVFMKTKASIDFINEWLQYCQNYNIISDAPNICGKENLKGFINHRHDQSVLSLLSIKHGIIKYRDPSQWGNEWLFNNKNNEGRKFRRINKKFSNHQFEESTYQTLINVHRKRIKPEPGSKLKTRINYFLQCFYELKKIHKLQAMQN